MDKQGCYPTTIITNSATLIIKKTTKKPSPISKKIIDQEDVLVQTVYNQFAHAYLRAKENRESLSAFHSAAQMSNDVKIKEEAW